MPSNCARSSANNFTRYSFFIALHFTGSHQLSRNPAVTGY